MGNLTRLTLVATPTDLPIGNPDLEMLHTLTYTTQVTHTHIYIHSTFTQTYYVYKYVCMYVCLYVGV